MLKIQSIKRNKKLFSILLFPLMIHSTYAFEAGGGDDGSAGANDTRVSIGEDSTTATSANGIAIGTDATVTGKNAQAVGLGAEATNSSAIAVGTKAHANGNKSDAIGWHAEAHSGQSIAIGSGDTNARRTIAGAGNRGTRSIAIGSGNSANGQTITRGSESIALGSGASTARAATSSVAIGTSASVSSANSVALGSNSIADTANTISVGSAGNERQIVNVADGVANHDAVNVNQLNTAYNNDMSLTGTTVSVTDGNSNVSVDLAGLETTQGTTNTNDITTNADAIAADTDGDETNELVTDTSLNGTDLEITEAGTIHTVDLSSLDQSKAVISNAENITINSEFTLTGSNLHIKELRANGTVASELSVNLSDLETTQGSVNADNIALNGLQIDTNTRGIAINSSRISANTRRIAGVEHKVRYVNVNNQNIAVGKGAVAGDTGSVALGNDARVAKGTSGAIAFGKQSYVSKEGTNSVALGQYSVANEANTISVGNDNLKRRITNVADGINDYDAVNMRQYHFLDSKINGLGAMTSAMSALVPNGRSSKNTQVSLGLGAYEGEAAFAMGAFHYVNDDLLLNAAVSHSSDAGTATRVGITWGF